LTLSTNATPFKKKKKNYTHTVVLKTLNMNASILENRQQEVPRE